jgi:hypothetical protein
MPSPVSPAPAWTIAGRTAAATDGPRLDLDAPARGLVLPTGDAFLGIDLRTPCRAGDHWVRGDDLLAVYEPADARRLRATAMWRPFPVPAAADCAAWELTLSAQTALVQSDSALAVTADVGGGEMRWSRDDDGTTWATDGEPPAETTALLFRPRTEKPARAILIAAHLADARRLLVRHTAGGRVEVACWLFSSAIEKGVLLRGRVLAAIGPATDAEAWAATVVTAFAASPPPLTA